MGRRQAVRQRTLTPPSVGSNPAGPTKSSTKFNVHSLDFVGPFLFAWKIPAENGKKWAAQLRRFFEIE